MITVSLFISLVTTLFVGIIIHEKFYGVKNRTEVYLKKMKNTNFFHNSIERKK